MKDLSRSSVVSPQGWIDARCREETEALQRAMAEETVRFRRLTFLVRRARIRRRIMRESGHGPRQMY